MRDIRGVEQRSGFNFLPSCFWYKGILDILVNFPWYIFIKFIEKATRIDSILEVTVECVYPFLIQRYEDEHTWQIQSRFLQKHF